MRLTTRMVSPASFTCSAVRTRDSRPYTAQAAPPMMAEAMAGFTKMGSSRGRLGMTRVMTTRSSTRARPKQRMLPTGAPAMPMAPTKL